MPGASERIRIPVPLDLVFGIRGLGTCTETELKFAHLSAADPVIDILPLPVLGIVIPFHRIDNIYIYEKA